MFPKRPVQHAQAEGGCGVSLGVGDEGADNLQSGESEDHVMATARLHAWQLQATGQAHLGRWRVARSRERVSGADVGIEVFDAGSHRGGRASRRAIACFFLELSFEWTEEAWKECRRSIEDTTETVAAAGGARTRLETPTSSDARGRDVFTITLLTQEYDV